MSLKPEISLGASLALVAVDYGIFSLMLPNVADIRASAPHNSAVEGSRKGATAMALGVCAALSLLAKDPNLFIVGGGVAVAMDWYFRHANAVHPASGQVTMPPSGGPQAGGVSGS